MSDSISDRMDDLNKGMSRVMENGHTVLLGWNDKTIPTIIELSNSYESDGGGVIVVLAERDKQQMEEEVAERCEEFLQGTPDERM